MYALILRQVWRTFCFLEDGLNLNKDNDSDVDFQSWVFTLFGKGMECNWGIL